MGQVDRRRGHPDRLVRAGMDIEFPSEIAVAGCFPGVGRRYLATFPDFRFELHFESPQSLTWTQIHADGSRGRSESVAIRMEPIADSLFLVAWQERNRTTVVHVEDFARRVILTHITRPDHTVLQARGTFSELAE